MLVTRSNFDAVIEELKKPGYYALDTETTGLSSYKGDRPFSIIIAREKSSWYFNFQLYDLDDSFEHWLLPDHLEKLNAEIFKSKLHRWYLHNAKFDLHMLGSVDCELCGIVYCTYGHGRLLHNNLMFYNLDFLSKRWLKQDKSDLVKEYALKHGLYTEVQKGKEKKKNIQFWRVPLNIVQEYAEKDALLTYELALFERKNKIILDRQWRKKGQPGLFNVSLNETKLTKVLYDIEKTGVHVDKDYCEKALNSEGTIYRSAAERFKEISGVEFDGTDTSLKQAFANIGIKLPIGRAGRVLTNKEVLAKIEHPLVPVINEYRKSYKKAVTYYANYLAMCDEHSTIHADFHQGGTKTGRLSCRDPNLQNLNRPDKQDLDDENIYTVRRAFTPREGFVFFAPDYDQIEYRMMLEYAQEKAVIEMVNAGIDVHQATANLLGVDRFRAKTINFLMIYGGGIAKFAAATGLTWDQAKDMFKIYFSKLPHVQNFVERVRYKAAVEGSTYNWLGRRYTFEDPERVYTTAPNWLIQGGCADVLKIALIKCHSFLADKKARTRIVLNIHDEIVFELHKNEFELAPQLVEVMENIYQGTSLKLTAGPAYSTRSLADKIDGYPQ